MKKPIQVKIRPAVISDAEQIATLFMRTWYISLKDIVPEGFLDRFQHKVQKEKYEQRILDAQYVYFVAQHDNNIVGMVGARDNHAEPIMYQKEIRAMYVDPDFQRQDIGTLLFNRLLSELRDQQTRNAMLWCIKANDVARSFYEKHDGKRIEITHTPEEYLAMPHVAYAWELPST